MQLEGARDMTHRQASFAHMAAAAHEPIRQNPATCLIAASAVTFRTIRYEYVRIVT